MIVVSFHTWYREEAPYYVTNRIYAHGWWTPFCHASKQYHPTMGPIVDKSVSEHNYIPYVRISHYYKPWWREHKEDE